MPMACWLCTYLYHPFGAPCCWPSSLLWSWTWWCVLSSMASAILAKHGLQNLHLINASFVILHNVIVSWITRLDTKPAWIRLKNRRFYVQVKNSLIVENGKKSAERPSSWQKGWERRSAHGRIESITLDGIYLEGVIYSQMHAEIWRTNLWGVQLGMMHLPLQRNENKVVHLSSHLPKKRLFHWNFFWYIYDDASYAHLYFKMIVLCHS